MCIDSNGNYVELSSPPDATQRRTYIYLGVVVHSNNVNVNVINQEPITAMDVGAQVQDILSLLGFRSTEGNKVTFASNDLTIQKTAGVGFKAGANFRNLGTQPHTFTMPALNPVTFRYRNQDGTEGSDVTNIDATTWDNAGVTTTVSSSSKATIQRVFIFPSNIIRIQRGQQVFNNFSTAIAEVGTEQFIEETNISENGLYIGSIILQKNVVNLSNTARALFVTPTGVVSSSSVNTTLQASYNVSVSPQIVTNSEQGKLIFKRGSLSDSDTVLSIQNGASSETYKVTGLGNVTANSFIKTGGTSSQFLKADGSIDSNVYLTSETDSQTLSWVLGTRTLSISNGNSVVIPDNDTIYTHPNHTGDVTSTGDGATLISANAVTNPKLNTMSANTIKGRISTLGNPQDLTASQVRSILNVEDGATADQATIVGITGTKSEFNTALTDGDFLFVGDVVSNVSTSLSLGTITGTSLGITSDGSTNDVVLPQANTSQAGLLSASKWNEIVANNAKVTFPGYGSVTNHTDIGSATNTNRFALMANGTTGYVGRAIVEADISDLQTYLTSADLSGLIDGSGTANQIPIFSDADTLTSSANLSLSSTLFTLNVGGAGNGAISMSNVGATIFNSATSLDIRTDAFIVKDSPGSTTLLDTAAGLVRVGEQFILRDYGVGTYSGTEAYLLSVTSSGSVIETPLSEFLTPTGDGSGLTGVMNLTTAQSVAAGIKKTFQSNAINAGIRLAGVTANPSTLVNGDIWFRTTQGVLNYRENGTTRTLATLAKAQTLTNKTISAAAFIGTQTGFIGNITGNASTATIASSITGQGALATKNSVAAAQIDANAVGSSEIAANAVGVSELKTTTMTYGSIYIANNTNVVIPAGFYTFGAVGTDANDVQLEVYSGSSWQGSNVSFRGGSILSDGTNVRFSNQSGVGFVYAYYRKMA